MQRRAVKDAIWGEMKGIKIPTQMQWSWKTVWIYVSRQLLYFCVGFSVFKQNKSHVWRLTSQSMLGFSWISGCMEISHSTWRLPRILGAEPHMERRRERERPVKYCTRSYTVILAAQCHLQLPPLSVSSPWFLIPVESMGSALSGATQTKTDRYSNKSLVGWFL